jgi:ATPase subunit of ABC transporter with duplicated ATPase domains
VQSTVDLLKEFEEINAKFAEPMDDDAMNALIERQGQVQEKLDHADAWDLDSRLEMAMDCTALSAAGNDGKYLIRWRKTPRRSLPLLLQKPDILLLDEPTNISMQRRSRGSNGTCKNTRGRSLPVTHDRYFLDNIRGLDTRARPR